MADHLLGRLLGEMTREEWRLHSRLFGGARFAAFPVVVALLVGVTTELLVRTGTDISHVLAGLHVLVVLLGLQTGTVGLVGRDMLRNLLGDVTLILSASRTLPVAHRRLLGLFVVKDVGYYAVLFLLPVAVGLLPAVLAGPALVAGLPPALQLALVWASLVLSFLLGIAITLLAVGVTSQGVPAPVVGLGIGGLAAWVWLAGIDLVPWTPYGLLETGSWSQALIVIVGVVVLAVAAASILDVETRTPARRTAPAFARWRRFLVDPVATKSLLDLHRSTGGAGKVLFSGGVLFLVSIGLFELASRITGLTPSVGICFGAILGLTSFTTYNWITEFDDLDSYLSLPLDVTDVIQAKLRAMLVVGPPVALVLYALAVAWQTTPWLEALLGLLLLSGVGFYVLGLTVRMAGLSPNRFLFDAPRFAIFSVAMMVPMVPALIVGLALSPPSPSLALGLALLAAVMAAAGYLLYRQGLKHWASAGT